MRVQETLSTESLDPLAPWPFLSLPQLPSMTGFGESLPAVCMGQCGGCQLDKDELDTPLEPKEREGQGNRHQLKCKAKPKRRIHTTSLKVGWRKESTQLLEVWDWPHKAGRLPALRSPFPNVPMTSVSAMESGDMPPWLQQGWAPRPPRSAP